MGLDKARSLEVLKDYPHQVMVLRRMLRKHGSLHQDKFDDIFGEYVIRYVNEEKRMSRRAPSFGFISTFGLQYMLGDVYGGVWAKWLDLLQLLIVAGQVEYDGKLPNVKYRLAVSQ